MGVEEVPEEFFGFDEIEVLHQVEEDIAPDQALYRVFSVHQDKRFHKLDQVIDVRGGFFC